MIDIFLATVIDEIKKRSELSKRASDAYQKLKNKDSKYADDILDLVELHNSIYTVCMQAKIKHEQERDSTA